MEEPPPPPGLPATQPVLASRKNRASLRDPTSTHGIVTSDQSAPPFVVFIRRASLPHIQPFRASVNCMTSNSPPVEAVNWVLQLEPLSVVWRILNGGTKSPDASTLS